MQLTILLMVHFEHGVVYPVLGVRNLSVIIFIHSVSCGVTRLLISRFVVQVFKGLNETTGELFAVKQIRLTDGSQSEILALEPEINLMKDLDHR